MIDGKSVLAIIPARGGSKGIQRKNIRDLCGKPLIAWTIDEAKKSKYIDKLILSSEDDEIISIAKKYGCEVPFVRTKNLAEDDTPWIVTVLHAIEMLDNYQYIVLLQPTSPLRTVDDIDGCIEYCITRQANACVTICEANHSPYWMYNLGEDKKMLPILQVKDNFYRRQALPTVYQLNGAVYISEKNYLIEKKKFVTDETIGYVMPQNRSVDIDNEMDFKIVENILSFQAGK